MAFKIKQNDEGKWEWSCFQSAYGAAAGESDTLAEAKVELYIAESAIMESPLPPQALGK